MSLVCARGSCWPLRSSSDRSTVTCVAACACSCWAKAAIGANVATPMMTARTIALGRVRTGLDRPRNGCDLVARAGHMEDVSRDAGDSAARLKLNLVRTIGDALVAHVEGCIFGKVEARFLRRGVGVLECLVWADLKIDQFWAVPVLASATMLQDFWAAIFMLVTWMP